MPARSASSRPLWISPLALAPVVLCLLAGITMPGGATLDYYTHGWDTMVALLPNRTICAVLLAGTVALRRAFRPRR